MNNKRKFNVTEPDGTVVELAVVRPSVELRRDADIFKSVQFGKYAKAGILFKDVIEKCLRDQGVWDDEKEAKRQELFTKITSGVTKLKAGGIRKSEAKKVALETQQARLSLAQLMADFNQLERDTVEGKSEQDKFEWLISKCTVYDQGGKPYFSSLTDYKDKEDQPHVEQIAEEFAGFYYGAGTDVLKELPENKFLIDYGFMNDKFEMLDETGVPVKIEEPKPVEFQPFLDD